jgi:hypothetical protein
MSGIFLPFYYPLLTEKREMSKNNPTGNHPCPLLVKEGSFFNSHPAKGEWQKAEGVTSPPRPQAHA